MVIIDLTPEQAEELKNHYIHELEKLQQSSLEIIEILKTLIHEPVHFEKQPDTSIIKSTLPAEQIKPVVQNKEKRKRRGRPPRSLIKSTLPGEQITSVIQTEDHIKHRGRPLNNPLWAGLIIQLLKEKGKAQSREQIIHAYEKHYKVEISGSKPEMIALNRAIQYLRIRKKQITSIGREGKRGKLFTLINPSDTPTENLQAKPKHQSAISSGKTSATDTKYNWSQFIIDTLAKTKRILTLKDFYNYAVVDRTIPKSEKKLIYGKLSPVLTKMVRLKNTIRTVNKDGLSFKFYGLNEWFDSKQELIKVYQ